MLPGIQFEDARRSAREFLADFAIDLVDGGCVCNEKQLLPDVFGAPVRNSIDKRVQDFVPCIVIVGSDPLVVMEAAADSFDRSDTAALLDALENPDTQFIENAALQRTFVANKVD
jgi:hypothetical protein